MAKKEDNVDLDAALAGDEKPKKSKKAAAAEEAAPAKKTKKPAAEEAPAKKGKKAAEEAPAKKGKKAEAASRGESRTEEIRAVIRKIKKATSYADIAAKGDPEFDIRSVRRTARAMRDAGEAELTKEGRDVFVKGIQ